MTQSKRQPTWAVEDTQDGWLMLRRGGMPVDQIAAEAGVSPVRVRQGIAAARAREPSPAARAAPPRRPSLVLTIAFGSSCKPLKLLRCGDVHRGPMPEGTTCCCAACDRTGVEDHPDLRIAPGEMPKPEPKPKPGGKARRRKQKLARSA